MYTELVEVFLLLKLFWKVVEFFRRRRLSLLQDNKFLYFLSFIEYVNQKTRFVKRCTEFSLGIIFTGLVLFYFYIFCIYWLDFIVLNNLVTII